VILSYDQLQDILGDMHPWAWAELGRLHVRQPLGARISGRAVATLEHLGLAKPIGRQNLEHGITTLGAHIWKRHRPEEYRR
jgi:hypothetical protein